MQKVAIYLAGSIKKGHENTNESFWTDEDMKYLRDCLHEYQVSFLNPAFRTDSFSDQHSVFGRDMVQVFCSDVVFVDARDRRGLGVGAEMMWAKVNKIPVITLAPLDSHYHKKTTTLLGIPVENWIHPFVESLSDCIVSDLAQGTAWIKNMLAGTCPTVKDIEHIASAMRYYKATQLEHDEPMQTMINANDILKTRVNTLQREI